MLVLPSLAHTAIHTRARMYLADGAALCALAVNDVLNIKVVEGNMVDVSLKAANLLEQEGISAEVIDPRTLFPLDR